MQSKMNKSYILLLFSVQATLANINYKNEQPWVSVNKCCLLNELYVDNSCRYASEVNESLWIPTFTTENGKIVDNVHYGFVTGLPDCGSATTRSIYFYKNSTDSLRLLEDGKLRHCIYHEHPEECDPEFEDNNGKELMSYDYLPGKYCMDKKLVNGQQILYALICVPKDDNYWSSTEFLMRNIINPMTHLIAMTCLLFIAIVYFIMHTLRDLVGNIITTIAICLMISQAADMTRLLTIFVNHVSLIAAEAVCYISLLGGFFWLNSLGYYIWRSFRSRNVYLRITDGKKYCYYSSYAWLCTIIMGTLAIFAHYTMDYAPIKSKNSYEQEQIGSLAMIILFMPVSFTVIVDVFFIASTMKTLGRMKTYGRIHHKLKHSFRMFVLLFLVMTLMWIFFLLSFAQYNTLIYCYIILNTFQAPLVLYICIFNQKHVSFLLRKTCCYEICACKCCKPEPEIDWADEMTAMNTFS